MKKKYKKVQFYEIGSIENLTMGIGGPGNHLDVYSYTQGNCPAGIEAQVCGKNPVNPDCDSAQTVNGEDNPVFVIENIYFITCG